MSWRDALEPTRMDRIAVVAPADRLRDALVTVADLGLTEPERLLDPVPAPAASTLEQVRRTASPGQVPGPVAVLHRRPPDLADLARRGRLDELAGEAELEQVAAAAVLEGRVAGIAAWSPTRAVEVLADRLRPVGAAVVRLPPPAGVDPPTLLAGVGAAGAFQPLVDTYVTVPYADVNPSVFAGVAYVAMFGMMFGDVGHGLLLTAAGLLVWAGRPVSLARFRWVAPFVIGAGLASAAFGLLFGEAFGPTGLVPTLWLAPLDRPASLLAAAVAIGAVLLAVAYGLGTANRWREGGAARALLALAGLAGSALYVGLALAGLGWYLHLVGLTVAGGVLAGAGLLFGFAGLYGESGHGVAGVAQAGVELFDTVVRLGTNTVSFARLAAFGLTHAALGQVVWDGTTALWHRGPLLWLPAAVVLVAGNALAFTLEALVAGVQALRLEYYELFSRIFTSQGRAFRPWHVPTLVPKERP